MTERPLIEPAPAGRPLRLAVIGAGRWGGLHAAKLAGLPGVEVVAVVDRDRERAARLAAAVGARPLGDVARLGDAGLDGATVAVTLDQLAPVTARLLDMGLHVLAEKPLALDGRAARRLVGLAARRRRLLAVGYLERFLDHGLAGGRRLVARRVGPARSAAPLWLDWMVHDLDHALRLLGPLRPAQADFAGDRARVRLVGPGREARIVAARRGERPRRRLWLDGARIDLAAGGDPLAAQLAAFCGALRGAAADRLATGADAAAVLDLLDALRAARPAA